MYYVYILKNTANKLYVGITTSPEKRVTTHNTRQGACFTKQIPTFSLVFLEKYKDMSSARKREIQIKEWRREKKEFLIQKYTQGFQTN